MIELILKFYEQINEDPTLLSRRRPEITNITDVFYEDEEILEAFKYASSLYRSRSKKNEVRYLSQDEIRIFTQQGYGLLMALQMAGIVGPRFVDMVMTRAVILQSLPIDVPDVEALAEYYILNPDNINNYISFDILFFTPPTSDDIN